MKALIISGANLDVSPYAFLYISHLQKFGAQIEIAVWDRRGNESIQDKSIKLHVFSSAIDNSIPKIQKLPNFLAFRRFLKRILAHEQYDLVIALTTQFAVLISDILFRDYPGRFIYDMRDLSYESFGFYLKRMNQLVAKSALTFVSSDGYRQFFTDNSKVFTLHNYQEADLIYANLKKFIEKKAPIRLSYWGIVRDFELNRQIVDLIADDQRFVLTFHGESMDGNLLKQYVEQKAYSNIFFTGYYTQDQRAAFAENTDLLHNIYSNEGDVGNPAMGNKFYDGIIFKIPQICLSGGFMGQKAEEKQVGICCRIDESLPDTLYSYYTTLDVHAFRDSCDKALSEVLEEQSRSLEQLHRVIASCG